MAPHMARGVSGWGLLTSSSCCRLVAAMVTNVYAVAVAPNAPPTDAMYPPLELLYMLNAAYGTKAMDEFRKKPWRPLAYPARGVPNEFSTKPFVAGAYGRSDTVAVCVPASRSACCSRNPPMPY